MLVAAGGACLSVHLFYCTNAAVSLQGCVRRGGACKRIGGVDYEAFHCIFFFQMLSWHSDEMVVGVGGSRGYSGPITAAHENGRGLEAE
ncbi:hypothetical protein NPIL_114581 [Nephila pilipes]|uniref:Secreted protein n=1 Tax=Nephila pilipes TaxID=299642 RepID=A0A8X6NWR9_NEPPI|nr:hypothetical protein NPIL_114581 [Nephila pilipes]